MKTLSSPRSPSFLAVAVVVLGLASIALTCLGGSPLHRPPPPTHLLVARSLWPSDPFRTHAGRIGTVALFGQNARRPPTPQGLGARRPELASFRRFGRPLGLSGAADSARPQGRIDLV